MSTPHPGKPAAGPGVVSALRRHVVVLAAAPRNRGADPAHLSAARRYVIEQLHTAGWTLTEQPFTTPAGLGVSDAGYPVGHLWPLRIRGPVRRVNIIATRGRPITGETLVVLAQLDSVRNSPGADDKASGVAVILEAAEQIPDPNSSDTAAGGDVALALVDLEEISLAGSNHLAKTVSPQVPQVPQTATVGLGGSRWRRRIDRSARRARVHLGAGGSLHQVRREGRVGT